MPDISMCMNKDCKKKTECYRYMAVPCEFRQSYIMIEDASECKHFWQIEKSQRLRELSEEEDNETN